MQTPFPQPLLAALTYQRAPLSSTDPTQWEKLKRGIKTTPLWDLPTAPKWKQILDADWTIIPDTPSPLAMDRATRQQLITSALIRHPRDPIDGHAGHPPKLTLHFSSPRQRRADTRKANLKRKALTTREPLRGSDAKGENADIRLVFER